MADKAESPYILVLPGPKTPRGSVALWEKNTDHPKTAEFPQGGEAYVANTKPRWVAKTPAVNIRLADGRLKEVNAADHAGKDPAKTPYRLQPHAALDEGENPLPIGVAPTVPVNADKGTGERPNPGGGEDGDSNSDGTVQVPNDPDIQG